MILKKRSKPPEILQLETLIQRTPSVHPLFPQWTEKLRRMSAGFHGEQRVDTLWNEIQLNLPHYLIHDLFIQKTTSSHQIDTLVVTNSFILLLEIKSIAGLLNFDPQLRQFSRTNKDGSIDGMRNPDDQLRRHEKWVEDYIARQGVKLPVVGAIIFTYPSSVIQSRSGNRIMIQSSGLPYLIEQMLLKFPKDILTTRKTKHLAQKLVDLHTIKQLEILPLPAGFVKGVLCPNCPGRQLVYRSKKWFCSNCPHIDPNAHLLALEQYRVSINPIISSREFREFTGIASVSVASKLLKESKMAFQGSFKDRVYLIPESFIGADSISAVPDSIL